MAQQNQSNSKQENTAGQKGQQAGQFNQQNQKNAKGMGSETKNLKSGRIADADASEDTDETNDVTWGSDNRDEDSDVGTQKNRGSQSKKH